MACGTLFDYKDSFRSYKALISAAYSGYSLTVDNSFKFGETNKSQEFRKKFPLGKVPAFESSDGHCIFESNAIAYYVANEVLRGTNPVDAALIQQYVNFADNEILPAASVWVFPTLGLRQYNKQETEKAITHLKECLTLLNNALLTRTFLVGERVTLADITVCCNLLLAYKQVFDPQFRKTFQNVNRWFLTCINQPQFKKYIGEFTLCEKMAVFDAKKYNELHPKEKKGKDKKEEKPKQEPKKESKKSRTTEEADDANDEQEPPAPKEKKDPFAALPPSKFVLDEWKRCYSNNDTEKVAIPWFWENFDKEGYSIWYAEYKYNDELTRIFMSCNLVGGMLQRLEKLKKNAFASILIFGEDGNNSISGIWIFRGQQLGFDLNEDWQIDSPSYTFTKLDPLNEEHRTKVNDYLRWEGDFGGKTVNQGKIFK